MSNKPAILGGDKAFKNNIPIIKPTYNVFIYSIMERLKQILNSNMVSNVNRYVKDFEDGICDALKVNNAVAISSCTLGMILTIQQLGLREKEIIMPSYSFSASAHMAYWNNCDISFVDIDSDTWNINPDLIEDRITKKTGAILAVHLYGNPARIEKLKRIADENNLELLFDAAHALGSEYKGKSVSSSGLIHSYSLSPTKLLSSIEGGLITTDDYDLAEKVRIARNYGNYPDYNCKLPGLNARMSELYAAIGLTMLDSLDEFVENRNKYFEQFIQEMSGIPGIVFQKINGEDKSSHKDFCLYIDSEKFGLDRNQLSIALKEEGISTKFYFYPPIHQMDAYKEDARDTDLKVTEDVSSNILSLPIHNYMNTEVISQICTIMKNIHLHGDTIKEKLER